MNTAWPEHRIKLYLDGTFTRLQNDGRVHTSTVELDFIPAHNGRDAPIRQSRKNDPWTPEDDAFLESLRARNIPRHRIGEYMGRSEESVRRRITRSIRMAKHAALR